MQYSFDLAAEFARKRPVAGRKRRVHIYGRSSTNLRRPSAIRENKLRGLSVSSGVRPFSCLAVAFITAFFGRTQMQFCRCNQLECPKNPALLRFPYDMFNIPYAKF